MLEWCKHEWMDPASVKVLVDSRARIHYHVKILQERLAFQDEFW
jgi:hypothetical protein